MKTSESDSLLKKLYYILLWSTIAYAGVVVLFIW